MIKKIISGGQTGADRAALDAAIALGIPHGGWVPRGRAAEDGRLPDKYELQEMPSKSYPERTEQNVIDSDGTIIISHGDLTGGSALTMRLAKEHNRPCAHIDLDKVSITEAVKFISSWLVLFKIETLNVAGSRASKHPEIYLDTYHILGAVLRPLDEK